MVNTVPGIPDSRCLVRFFQEERKCLGDHKRDALQKKGYKLLWACVLETGLGWAGGGGVGKGLLECDF